VTGVDNAIGTHAIWHDSDLFLDEPGFLDRHFKACRDGGLSMIGLDEAWDDWYRNHGMPHVVSTWETAYDLAWVRSFKPWEHRGYAGSVGEQQVTFDITFGPQTQTQPAFIARNTHPPRFLHFNHTIGTYRAFQRSFRRRRPHEDSGFRVLLVRLLADALDGSNRDYEAPTVNELIRGLRDAAAPVTYTRAETVAEYPAFRAELENVIQGGFLGIEHAAAMSEGVRPFDEALDWPGAS
jgi:hypothetical protein